MASEVCKTTRRSNSGGKIRFGKNNDAVGGTYKADTDYIVEYRHYYCVRDNSNDSCDTNKERDEFMGVVGEVTGGTGTGGDNGPTVPNT